MEQEQEDILISKRELFELEDYIRQMWQFLPIPIAFISPLGIILEVDEHLETLLGYPREELVGRSLLDYCSEKEKFAQIQERTLNGNPVKNNEECSFMNAQGQKISVGISTLARIDEELGEPVGYFIALWNITERKQTGERLQKSYDDEKGLRQELEAQIDKRIELTRTLVHELKTPLTPMIAASELLMEEVPDGPLFRLARSINKGAELLAKRIDTLIDAAKGELGILELVRTETDLLDLLHRIAEDATPLAYSHNQVLNAELPVSLPTVSADGERLRQVVVNLLDNGFKFTPEGGRITLRAEKKGDAIIIEVEDTGPGIPVDQQQHLFEAHYHVKSENKRGSGLGLGLALSKMLVELHGGKIWVESKEGKGSKFVFSVPLRSNTSRSPKH
ncbi:MAG: PAS domain-containing sensor histidine kinase [Chloroflexota bacterium]